MTRYRVLPYRQGSKGARALADALGGRVLKLEGSSFSLQLGDVVINWGHTGGASAGLGGIFLNDENTIRNASNKKNFFQLMTEKGLDDVIPKYWTTKETIPDDAFPIVCRTVLAGHSGDGIVIADTPAALVAAPLYVQYVKKQDEYRIHVGILGENTGYPYSEGNPHPVIISIQRKARRHDTPSEEVNWQVRNHANGFVYVREGVNPPAAVLDAAKKALDASGLDFGAVDVIYNKEKSRAYVLEINTAPGLEGQTVADYVDFFKS